MYGRRRPTSKQSQSPTLSHKHFLSEKKKKKQKRKKREGTIRQEQDSTSCSYWLKLPSNSYIANGLVLRSPSTHNCPLILPPYSFNQPFSPLPPHLSVTNNLTGVCLDSLISNPATTPTVHLYSGVTEFNLKTSHALHQMLLRRHSDTTIDLR